MRTRNDDASQLGARVKNPDGSVIFEARVASTAAMPYVNPDGSTRIEMRAPSALRSIVDQLAGLPITNDHPLGMVRDGSAADVIGEVLSARVESTYDDVLHAVAKIRVRDAAAIREIDGGKIGLSLGYQCSTTHDAESDVHWQDGISLDHLALVGMPRCRTCTLRADERTDCAGACSCAKKSHDDDRIDDWDPVSNTYSSATPSGKKQHMPRNYFDHNDPSPDVEVDPDDLNNRHAPDETRAGRAAARTEGGWAQSSNGRTRDQAIAAMSRDRDLNVAGARTAAARTLWPGERGTVDRSDAAPRAITPRVSGDGRTVFESLRAKEGATRSVTSGPSPYNAMPYDEREARAAEKLRKQSASAWRREEK